MLPLILAGGICWVAASAVGAATEAGVVLVRNGQPKAVMVLAQLPSRAATEAAQILGDHLFQISGARLETRRENELEQVKIEGKRIMPPAGWAGIESFLLVGASELAQRMGLTADGLGPGGILVRTVGNCVGILGPDDRTPTDPMGTRHAAITFLEECLGVRYLWPGELGKVIPKRTTVILAPMERRFTPPIGQRNIRVHGCNERHERGLAHLGFTRQDWERRYAEATATVAPPSRFTVWHRLGGDLGIHGGHAFGHLWEKYGKEHPEWFALQKDGTRDQSRAGDRARLCKSNPGLIEAIAREKIEELNQNPGRVSVSLSPNDGGYSSFCMCEACKALDPPEAPKVKLLIFEKVGESRREEIEYPSLTDRMVHFWNAIAERVTKVHPNALFVVDAYSCYQTPAVRETLRPNLVVRYVPSTPEHWEGWRKKASRIYWRPNLLHGSARDGMLRLHADVDETFRYFLKSGMMATDFDSILNSWATNGLDYYLVARLNWNPNEDADAIIEDYCRTGFGPAAAPIRRYFDRVAAITGLAPSEHTPETVRELRALLDEADRAAANDETIRKRIAFLRVGLDWHEIQMQAHRLLADARAGKPVDRTEARRLLDRRYQMMRHIHQNHLLAVSVEYVSFYDWGLWRQLGWTGPSTTDP